MKMLNGLAAGVFALAMGSAQAAVKDQSTSNILSDTASLGAGAVGQVAPNRDIVAAQTVTAGISGYLSQVEVWVGRQSDTTGSLFLSVLNVQNGLPSAGAALATFEILAGSIASSDIFTQSRVSVNTQNANISFAAGQQFAIVLSAHDAPVSGIAPYWSPYSWGFTYETYAQGARYVMEGSSGWILSSVADQAVVTYMELAAPIPEPETYAMFLAGLGLMGAIARRKKLPV